MALSVEPLADPYNLQGWNVDSGFNLQDSQPVSYVQPTYDTSGTYSSGGGSGGTTYYDPYSAYGGQTAYNQNIAQYDQGIAQTNAALGFLPNQQQNTNSKIDASYQDALNQLLGNEQQGKASYDTNVLQNKQDYVSGKNTVRSNAGSTLSGLLRLLGSRGAGGSSAATITAPGAIARQATLQQSDLGNTYGHNAQGLDTNWNNFEIGVNNQRSSAAKQREDQFNENNDRFTQQRASLLQTLATLNGQKAAYTGGNATAAAQPYLNQANALLGTVGNFRYTPINYQTQAYTAPTLDKYLSSSITPTIQGQAPTNDYVSPYLATLLKKQPTTTGA